MEEGRVIALVFRAREGGFFELCINPIRNESNRRRSERVDRLV